MVAKKEVGERVHHPYDRIIAVLIFYGKSLYLNINLKKKHRKVKMFILMRLFQASHTQIHKMQIFTTNLQLI